MAVWISFLFFVALQPIAGQGPHVFQASRSYSDTPHSVGSLWTSDQPHADSPTSPQSHTTHNRQTSMPSVGFEPAIPTIQRPQTTWPLGRPCARIRFIILEMQWIPVTEQKHEAKRSHVTQDRYLSKGKRFSASHSDLCLSIPGVSLILTGRSERVNYTYTYYIIYYILYI